MAEEIRYSEKKICPDCNCAYYDASCPLCGKDENGKKHRIKKERIKRGGSKVFWAIIIVAAVLTAGSWVWDEIVFFMLAYSGQIEGINNLDSMQGEPDNQGEIQEFPENGSTSYYTNEELTGVISITNELDDYMYVKFKSESFNKTILEAYIHPKSIADIKVPLGRYRVIFASGDEWYGKENMFGIDTVYYISNNIADIKIENNTIMNQSIEIYESQSQLSNMKKSSRIEFLD